MLQKFLRFLFVCSLFSITLFVVFCNDSKKQKAAETSLYLNHNDTVEYVGINTCKQCHSGIYETYIKTGMGKSFDASSKEKSLAKMNAHAVIHDKYSNFSYFPFWDKDSLKIMEFRIADSDTIYKRIETVDYIIGSGQHTNSHLYSTNGYLRQMPMTLYTQKETWDLPPGFENGFNTRFNRQIGLECMTCHNSFPNFKEGSENNYAELPNGINCERCHGPGELHVKEKMAGILVDTSKLIDYTIVNPGKLSIDLQFDVCQRCHLQGNAVLKNEHSFYDFKPGKKLADYMTVFLPKYKGAEEEFIMASHADRLKMSTCFIKSFIPSQSENALRPYKQSLTCVTCHNPHVSVKETATTAFNAACKNCHNTQKSLPLCSEKLVFRQNKNGDNCFNCHMPKSNTLDIPHVTTTDHFIRKPISAQAKKATKQFLGLYAINEKNPSNDVKCEAYINQFEKFDNNPLLLDSAEKYVDDKSTAAINRNIKLLVHLQFCRMNYTRIISYVNLIGKANLLDERSTNFKKSLDNKDAWLFYRIGESFSNTNNTLDAYLFYKRATSLAPFNLEFRNKLGSSLAANGKTDEAQRIFESIVKEDPKYAAALSNYGYSFLLQDKIDLAERYFDKALQIDPDLEMALLNKAGVLLYKKKNVDAEKILRRVLAKNPKNEKVKSLLKEL